MLTKLIQNQTLIIALLSTLISIISLSISRLNYKSDKYKLKNSVQFGIGPNGLRVFTISISNYGKRPVTIHGIDFLVRNNNQMVFLSDDLYLKTPAFPIRLDENTSLSVVYDMRYLVSALLEQNEILQRISIETQDKVSHHIKISRKKFNNMLNFIKD